MKFKYKLALSIFFIASFALVITITGIRLVTNSSTIQTELEGNEEHVQYVSETIGQDLFDLVRLSQTIASSDTLEEFLVPSNELYDALSTQDRLDQIAALNATWKNTDDIENQFIKDRMENEAALYLAEQQENSPNLFGELFLTNKYGLAIATTGKLTNLAHLEKYWWQGAFDNGDGIVYIDDRGFDESVSGYVLGIVIPIYDNDNQIIGILKCNYNISQIFTDSVSFFNTLKSDGNFYVVRTLGLIINGESIEPLTESVDNSIVPYLEENLVMSVEHQIDKTNYLLSVSPIDITFDSDLIIFGGSYDSDGHTQGNLGEGWSVIYLIDRDEVLSNTNTLYLSVTYIGLFGILFVSVIGLIVGGSLSKPISKLNKYVLKVGSGDLTKENLKIYKDEIGELTGSFNKMLDHLNATLVSKNKLVESEERFRTLFEKAPFGYQSLDDSGHFLEVNSKWLEIFGYKRDEVIGKWFGDFMNPEFQKKFKKRFEVFKKDGSIQSEFRMITKNGKTIEVGFDGNIGYGLKQTFKQTHCTVTDITEINIANEKLKYETELAQKYLNLAGVMIVVLDSSGSVTLINKHGCDIIGLEENDIIGKNWFENFVPKFIIEEVKQVFANVFEKKSVLSEHFENIIINSHGEERLMSWYNSILYDANKNVVGIISSGEDITDIRLEQNVLIESEDRLNRSQVIAQVGSWELNLKTNEIWASKEAFEIYELPRDSEFINLLKVQKMINNSDRKMMDVALTNLIQKGQEYDVKFGLNTLHKKKWIHSKAELSYDASGKPNKVLGVIRDISEIVVYEESLVNISNHDFLTGLYNRRFFVEEYKKMDNPAFYPLGIMMIDVNGLKIINDAFGHDVGDLALKKIARILEKSLRKQDIITRIGGDEFAVILPKISIDNMEIIKDKIKKEAQKETVENVVLSLATGYEIKTIKLKGNLDEILKLAENQMYRHKLVEGVSVRNRAIKAILKTLTDKYAEERIHSAKVSQLSKKVGEALGLTEEDLKELELAGMYHDIGKISIPDAILNKPGRLTEEEFEVIKTHPEISYQILRAADEYSDLAIHALYHHERWDGKGYPSGKKGEDIPLFSRIISVVDAYEAMTAVRVYKDKVSEDDAVKEIIRCSGTQFDQRIAKIFVEKVLAKKWKN